jgi:hypothetical protein
VHIHTEIEQNKPNAVRVHDRKRLNQNLRALLWYGRGCKYYMECTNYQSALAPSNLKMDTTSIYQDSYYYQ